MPIGPTARHGILLMPISLTWDPNWSAAPSAALRSPGCMAPSLAWVQVGQWVEVFDSDDQWRRAKVKKARVERSRREIYIHYNGWSASWDEWVRQPSRVRECADSEQTALENDEMQWGSTEGRQTVDGVVVWGVRKIKGFRKRGGRVEYLVEWDGEFDDSWQPAANIMDEQLTRCYLRRRERRLTAKTAMPYVKTVPAVAAATDEQRTQWQEGADFVEDAVGHEAIKYLCKQKGKSAGAIVLAKVDISPRLFVGLHARLAALAADLPGEQQKHISDIYAVEGANGGEKVVDEFKVNSYDIMERHLVPFNTVEYSHGPVYLRDKKYPVGLVGPWRFRFQTKRRGVGKERHRTWLIVKGHAAALRNTPDGPVWELPKFTDTRPDGTRSPWAHAHKIAMATAARRIPNQPEWLHAFLESDAGRMLA